MNRIVLARVYAMIFFTVYFFLSCKESPAAKKELWAVVINFFSPDPGYYPDMKKFPFPDSLQFAPPDSFFVNQGNQPIINDSAIILYNTYWENGKKLCCKKDTLEVYSDSINGKKYLFAIGEYIAIFQSDSIGFTRLRPRMNTVSVPLWGIKLNTPYPPEKIKNEYEKLGARLVELDERFDEVSKQKWNENDSIGVETIQFNNSNDVIITALSKDMNEAELNFLIADVKSKFPNLKYKEAIQKDSDGKLMKVIRISFQGVSMSFTQFSATEYSFMMTDYYETARLIIDNAGTGYAFRDDVKIY
jgi:hypothetical protein